MVALESGEVTDVVELVEWMCRLGGSVEPEQVEALATSRVLPIRRCDGSAYEDGGVVAKVVEPEGRQLLEQAVLLSHQLNEEWAGRSALAAWLVLSADPRVLHIKEQLRTWVSLHVAHRVARRRLLRRRGLEVLVEPFILFQEVLGELGPWLERVFGPEDRVHAVVGQELVQQYAWECTRHTVLSVLNELPEELRSREQVETTARSLQPEQEFHDRLGRCICLLPDPAPGCVRTYAPDELALLARDLRALRPRLIGRFSLRASLLELRPGLWMSWSWFGVRNLGIVGMSRSREALLQGPDRDEGAIWLDVDHLGRLVAPGQGWIHCLEVERHVVQGWLLEDELPSDLPTLLARLNLELLREVHRVQSELAPPQTDEAPYVIEEPEAPEPCTDELRMAATVDLQPLRLSELKRVLDRHFGVRWRPCQGSEVVFQKEGCRSYVLGVHGRNPSVGPRHLYRIHRRFGITLEAWRAATG